MQVALQQLQLNRRWDVMRRFGPQPVGELADVFEDAIDSLLLFD